MFIFIGKKKVSKKSDSDIVQETGNVESAVKKIAANQTSQRLLKTGKVYIQATYNNTIISVTDSAGGVIAWASAGSMGFKGAKKATPYAASRVVEAVLEKVKKIGLHEVEVFVKGVGGGRESAVLSIATHGLNMSLITDTTPLPHNGCRPPKVRRV